MTLRRVLLSLFTLLALGAFNVAVFQRERLLAEGRTVLLPLAPVDPRDPLRGDYMVLNYALFNEMTSRAGRTDPGRTPAGGLLVVQLDARGIGHFARLDDPARPLAPNEVRLRYAYQNYRYSLGAESFFFQEGQAKHYGEARYAELRVTAAGDVLLVGLRNSTLWPLGQP